MRTDEFKSDSLIRVMPNEHYTKPRFLELLDMVSEYNTIIETNCHSTYKGYKKHTFLNVKNKEARARLKELHAKMYENLMPVFKWQVRKKFSIYAKYYDDIFSILFFNLTYYGFRKLAWYIGICSARFNTSIRYERMCRYISNWVYLSYQRALFEDVSWERSESDTLMFLEDLYSFPSGESIVLQKEFKKEFVNALFTIPEDIRISKKSYFKALKQILHKLTNKPLQSIPVTKFEYDYTLYYLRKQLKSTKITVDDLFNNRTESELTLFDMIMEKLNGKKTKNS